MIDVRARFLSEIKALALQRRFESDSYLETGGTLETAQAMAAHETPRTTKHYDRTGDEITLDEVERIAIRSSTLEPCLLRDYV
jgi:hypothetical protein